MNALWAVSVVNTMLYYKLKKKQKITINIIVELAIR